MANLYPKEANLVPFKPGQSGNPTGRPKKEKNVVKALIEAFYTAESEEDCEAAYERINALLLASMVEKSLDSGGTYMHKYVFEALEHNHN